MNKLSQLLVKPFPIPVPGGVRRLDGNRLQKFRIETASRSTGTSIAAVEQFESNLQRGEDVFPSFITACTVLYFNLNRLEAITGMTDPRARQAFSEIYKDALESHNRLKENVVNLEPQEQSYAVLRLSHLSQYIENALSSQTPKNKSNEPSL